MKGGKGSGKHRLEIEENGEIRNRRKWRKEKQKKNKESKEKQTSGIINILQSDSSLFCCSKRWIIIFFFVFFLFS